MRETFAQSEIRRFSGLIAILAVMLVPSAICAAVDGKFEMPIWPGIAPGSAESRSEEEYSERPVADGTGVTSDRSVRGVMRPRFNRVARQVDTWLAIKRFDRDCVKGML